MKAIKFLGMAIALAPLMPAIALIYVAYLITPHDDDVPRNDWNGSNGDVTCLNSWSGRQSASSKQVRSTTILGM